MDIDIKKIAKLGALQLTDSEAAKIKKDMEAILDYVKQLDELDTENIEPTSHVLNLENVYRPDRVEKWEGREDVLKHAPQREGKFFKVPKIVDKQS